MTVPEDVATTNQARLLIEQQLLPPELPLTSAMPEGTTLLGVYISDRGDAFVDFSREINTEHSGWFTGRIIYNLHYRKHFDGKSSLDLLAYKFL